MKYDITEDVRTEAYEIALQRDKIARDCGRIMGKFHEDYNDIEVNHQGSIGEIMVEWIYPTLVLAQPAVINSANTGGTDFLYNGARIEVKCNRFYRPYPLFYINRQRLVKKMPDLVLCTSIEDKPSLAKVFTVHGWMSATEIMKYPVSTNISSPAYAVPVNDLHDPHWIKP